MLSTICRGSRACYEGFPGKGVWRWSLRVGWYDTKDWKWEAARRGVLSRFRLRPIVYVTKYTWGSGSDDMKGMVWYGAVKRELLLWVVMKESRPVINEQFGNKCLSSSDLIRVDINTTSDGSRNWFKELLYKEDLQGGLPVTDIMVATLLTVRQDSTYGVREVAQRVLLER